jgi:hypothetical protein
MTLILMVVGEDETNNYLNNPMLIMRRVDKAVLLFYSSNNLNEIIEVAI